MIISSPALAQVDWDSLERALEKQKINAYKKPTAQILKTPEGQKFFETYEAQEAAQEAAIKEQEAKIHERLANRREKKKQLAQAQNTNTEIKTTDNSNVGQTNSEKNP